MRDQENAAGKGCPSHSKRCPRNTYVQEKIRSVQRAHFQCPLKHISGNPEACKRPDRTKCLFCKNRRHFASSDASTLQMPRPPQRGEGGLQGPITPSLLVLTLPEDPEWAAYTRGHPGTDRLEWSDPPHGWPCALAHPACSARAPGISSGLNPRPQPARGAQTGRRVAERKQPIAAL